MNKRTRALIAAGLAGTLVLSSLPLTAFADTASELAEAAQRLESLGSELTEIQAELDACGEQLETCSYEIAQKQDEISRTQGELASAREVLARRMRSSYKAGTGSLLTVLLEAGSFEDLVNRIYYADRVAESDAASIGEVQTLQYQLNDQAAALQARQDELERTLQTTRDREAEYEMKVAEASAYYESLDAQLQAELAAQAAAEAEAREREEAAAMAKAMEAIQEEPRQTTEAQPEVANTDETASDNKTSTSTQPSTTKTETSTSDTKKQDEAKPETTTATDEQEKAGGQNTQKAEEPATPQPTETKEETKQTPEVTVTTYGGAGVDSAYSCIGCPYVWGAAGPSSFDCSGLVCYCYGYGRGRTTYDMISSLKATGDWKTSMSELSYGDLIFTSYGHVGIYLGNGTFIHAPAPGRTVCVQSVYDFVGGGSY